MIVTGEDRSLNAVFEIDATIVGSEVQKKYESTLGSTWGRADTGMK